MNAPRTKMFRTYVKVFWPIVLAIIAYFIAITIIGGDKKYAKIDFLFSGIMTISCTLSGFIVTVATLLLSIRNTSIMQYIHRNGVANKQLYMSIVSVFTLGIVTMLASLIMGGVYSENDVMPGVCMAGYIALSLAYIADVCLVLSLILRILIKSGGQTS